MKNSNLSSSSKKNGEIQSEKNHNEGFDPSTSSNLDEIEILKIDEIEVSTAPEAHVLETSSTGSDENTATLKNAATLKKAKRHISRSFKFFLGVIFSPLLLVLFLMISREAVGSFGLRMSGILIYLVPPLTFVYCLVGMAVNANLARKQATHLPIMVRKRIKLVITILQVISVILIVLVICIILLIVLLFAP